MPIVPLKPMETPLIQIFGRILKGRSVRNEIPIATQTLLEYLAYTVYVAVIKAFSER